MSLGRLYDFSPLNVSSSSKQWSNLITTWHGMVNSVFTSSHRIFVKNKFLTPIFNFILILQTLSTCHFLVCRGFPNLTWVNLTFPTIGTSINDTSQLYSNSKTDLHLSSMLNLGVLIYNIPAIILVNLSLGGEREVDCHSIPPSMNPTSALPDSCIAYTMYCMILQF
jgi:hypothetical protein